MYLLTPKSNINTLMPKYDVVILGAGHNGLIAAAYLAKAGKKVLVLEKNAQVGGATASVQPFKGVSAYLSRYSYLVALMPEQIIQDLELDFKLLPRTISSYTPDPLDPQKGILISTDIQQRLKAITEFTKNESIASEWESFYQIADRVARTLASTFLKPLPSKEELQAMISQEDWRYMIDHPIGKSIRDKIKDDVLQGIIATDALIGHFVDIDQDFSANLCFLYHLVSDWRVPQGGMGKLVHELVGKCLKHDVHFILDAKIENIALNSDIQRVSFSHLSQEYHVDTEYLLSNMAPQYLNQLTHQEISTLAPKTQAEKEYHVGAQVKVNLLLKKLPKLKSGIDPKLAFCGTFHVNETLTQLIKAYEQAKQGIIPDVIPCELYCHTLTDPTILSTDLVEKGYHTLTLFALQLPAQLFEEEREIKKQIVKQKILDGFNFFLSEPIEECLALDEDGMPCIEFKLPQDLEHEISLPKGNIFHRYFSTPYLETPQVGIRGVETKHNKVLICGAAAIRGGGVSGIPGYHAAQYILTR